MSECRNLDSLLSYGAERSEAVPAGSIGISVKTASRILSQLGNLASRVDRMKRRIDSDFKNKFIEIKFSDGDWETGPFNRAWIVEQWAKERNRSHDLRKYVNKLERRVAALEAK